VSIRLHNAVSPAGETVSSTVCGAQASQKTNRPNHISSFRCTQTQVPSFLRAIETHYCRFKVWFSEILSPDAPFVSCQLSYIIKWLRSDYKVHFRLVFERKRIFTVISDANVDPSTQVGKNVMSVAL
jgi:hypothetical protein